MSKLYHYQKGWGNHFVSEAFPGVLPEGQNSPQLPPFGLYVEQLSGTAFTVARHGNARSWLYRVRPTVGHKKFVAHPSIKQLGADCTHATVEQLRWKPFALPADTDHVDFLAGLHAIAGAGDPSVKNGICVYTYSCNTSMIDSAMCNADGDFLFVPQQGTLDIVTEFGRILVEPLEIAVIPVRE